MARKKKDKILLHCAAISTQIDKVSAKQISISFSELGKEEIMMTVNAKIGFFERK